MVAVSGLLASSSDKSGISCGQWLRGGIQLTSVADQLPCSGFIQQNSKSLDPFNSAEDALVLS